MAAKAWHPGPSPHAWTATSARPPRRRDAAPQLAQEGADARPPWGERVAQAAEQLPRERRQKVPPRAVAQMHRQQRPPVHRRTEPEQAFSPRRIRFIDEDDG